MQGKDNIENFLKKSTDNLANEYQDDWNVFDKKLSQARNLKRLKRFTAGTAVAAAVVFLFMTYNGYRMFWESDLYVPRTHDVVFDETLEETPFQTNFENLANTSSPSISYTEPTVANSENVSFESINKEVDIPINAIANQGNEALSSPNAAPLSQEESDPRDIALSSPMEDSNEGALVAQAEEFQLIDRKLNPKEELISLTSNRGFGEFNPGFGIQSAPEKNDKYLSFHVAGLSTLSPSSELVMPLKSPIKKIDFSKINKGAYISPLQAENAWSYSINIYPNYTFRKFELDEGKANRLHADFKDAVEAAESGGLSLNLGFEVNRRIAPVTYFNTGIEYISYKTEVLYNFLNFRDPIINKNNGLIDGYTIKGDAERISFSDKNIYHYINIPFSFSYQPWASDHIRLNIEGGASFLYFLAANGQTLNYKTLEVEDLSQREFRKSIGSLSMKFGANYYVNERINIGFEPTLMYFTNTIYDDDYPFHVIPYSVGLNFNLQVKLN